METYVKGLQFKRNTDVKLLVDYRRKMLIAYILAPPESPFALSMLT